MVCFKCGGSVPDKSTICPQCGTAVVDVPVPSIPLTPRPTGTARTKLTPEQQRCWNLAQSYARQPSTDGKSTASMVLGILSILLLFILAGIPAVVLGHMSLSKIHKSKGRLTGEGMAMAGLVLGYISIAFTVLVAAMVIPIARRAIANERAGVSVMRTLITAQTTYSGRYPAQGYASSMNRLGYGDPPADCADRANLTFEHACIMEQVLTCTAGAWCTNGTYNFSLEGRCGGDGACSDYVATATPIIAGSISKSYCSTADAVVRSKSGPRLSTPVAPEECQSWSPIS